MSNNNKNCLNCNTVLEEEDQYCKSCGQSHKEYNLGVSAVFKEFFNNIFNFDARFYQTLRNLHKPNFLTEQYIAGRRKSYVLPIQLFLFSLILLLTLVLYFTDLNQVSKLSSKTKSDISAVISRYDSLAPKIVTDTIMNDSLRRYTFDSYLDKDQQIFPNWNGGTVFGSNLSKYKITYSDVYTKSFDSIITEKKVTSWFDKKLISQSIKFEFNPVGSVKFFISNLSWVFLITCLLVAAIAKLLYIRHSMYYVEHLVLYLNIHSFSFIFVSILLLIVNFANMYIDIGTNWRRVSIVVWLGVVSYAYYKYYQQGFWKTLIKSMIIGFSGLIIFFMCALLILLINYFLFI